MNFETERNCFYHLKNNLKPEARAEYEIAVEILNETYNTAIHENRFISGGVVEILTLALMRSTGIQVEAWGEKGARGDLKLDTGQLISVKSSFTGKGNIKLVNKMGSDLPPWETATLFVLANIGMFTATPTMVKDDDFKDGNKAPDSRDITRDAINKLAMDSLNVLRMNLPLKPPKDEEGANRKVSDDVAIQLMEKLDIPILSDLVLPELTEKTTCYNRTKQIFLNLF